MPSSMKRVNLSQPPTIPATTNGLKVMKGSRNPMRKCGLDAVDAPVSLDDFTLIQEWHNVSYFSWA